MTRTCPACGWSSDDYPPVTRHWILYGPGNTIHSWDGPFYDEETLNARLSQLEDDYPTHRVVTEYR